MPIYLYIKGTASEAAQALSQRGFHPKDRLTDIYSYVPEGMTDYPISEVTVKGVVRAGVDRWFNDTTTDFKARTFPPGTLLHFSVTR